MTRLFSSASHLVFGLVAILSLSCKKAETHSVAHRIVSLSPSTTEAVYAIGAGEALVGRSRFCDHPKEVLALPIVSGFVDVNLEAVLSLSPDLVVGGRGPGGSGAAEQFKAHGISTFFPETETLAQIDELLLGLGERTGRLKEAKIRVAELQAREAAVARDAEGDGKPRVLLLFGVGPIVAAGPKSFGNEMLALAGSKNVVTEGGSYPTIDIERVIALDPDIIIDTTAPMGQPSVIAPSSPGWALVRAVREGHVIPISDESVLRPGPRVGEGLLVLAKAIHPRATFR